MSPASSPGRACKQHQQEGAYGIGECHGEVSLFLHAPGLGFVDVRDVALAHSLAVLDPRAKGRYICVSHSLNFLEMVCDSVVIMFSASPTCVCLCMQCIMAQHHG